MKRGDQSKYKIVSGTIQIPVKTLYLENPDGLWVWRAKCYCPTCKTVTKFSMELDKGDAATKKEFAKYFNDVAEQHGWTSWCFECLSYFEKAEILTPINILGRRFK